MAKEDATPDYNQTESYGIYRDLVVMGSRYGDIPSLREIVASREYPQTFKPEEGQKSEKLIGKVEALLDRREIRHMAFNEYVSLMIDLLGGKRMSEELYTSNPLQDTQNNQSVRLSSLNTGKLNCGWIEIGPTGDLDFNIRWGDKMEDASRPVVITSLTYGYSDQRHWGAIFPAFKQHLVLPEGHYLDASNLYGVELNRIGSDLFTDAKRLSLSEVRDFCSGVFEVYLAQQDVENAVTA